MHLLQLIGINYVRRMLLMNNEQVSSVKLTEFNLLELFEGFLSFWTTLSDKIEKHYNEDVILLNDKDEQVNNLPRYIQRQLVGYVEQQKKQVEQIALPQQQLLYEQFLYSMAAFVDDQLLQKVKWPEQKHWLPLMLELNLFGSRNSGEKLIEHIQKFSSQPNEFSDDEKALASCYLRILWLGFSGKYAKQPSKIKKLKSQLISNVELNIPDLTVKLLFYQAYQYNIINDKQSRLAPISRWQRFILLGAALYLVIAGLLWYVLTYQLESILSS